jgi:ferredoxin-type protein NapH
VNASDLKPKLGRDGKPMVGVNGRPMHLLLEPSAIGDKVRVWRFVILRRLTQLGILLLFFGTAHWGWSIAGAPLLTGNLSASEFLGFLPMADPFAVLQILLTRAMPEVEVLIGAAIILLLYGLIAGRSFCAWVCPLNLVTDLAGWLRRRLSIRDLLYLPRSTRYMVLLAALLLSAITAVAAFEWISPIGMLHRELVYGIGLGWIAVLGIFIFDLFVIRHGWCGHLCPLGAFYALLGKRSARLVVGFDAASCTHCAECATVCPEPQVLNLKKVEQAGLVSPGECSACGRCVGSCPEGSLQFHWRLGGNAGPAGQSSRFTPEIIPQRRSQ